MIRLGRVAELAAAADGDPMIMWAAQGLEAPVKAWALGAAVAVASPGLSARDRLMVHGDPVDAVTLTARVLDEVGPSFRPIGREALIERVAAGAPGLELAGRFGWMQATTAPPDSSGPSWLDPQEYPLVEAFLDDFFPLSYARPTRPPTSRWAAVRAADGELLAIAADAWSSPSVGLIAGVATQPAARGRGLAAATCGFVTGELLATREHVGLLVDYWNTAAIAAYTRIGFSLHRVAAAHVGAGR